MKDPVYRVKFNARRRERHTEYLTERRKDRIIGMQLEAGWHDQTIIPEEDSCLGQEHRG